MLKKNLFLTLCLGLLLLSSFGLAIEQYGSLSGTVVDESGVGLPGVEVTITGPALMGSRTTITNTAGEFKIHQLNIGAKYVVTFSLKGFKQVDRKDVRIELAKESRLAVMMNFGEITERVVVTGEIPIVDPKSSTTQLNISKEIVETLANDRQYQSIMEMMPGAIPGNNPAMMGAAGSDNMYQFDGMESTDPLTKTWSTAMNFDNFEEMQVVAQGAPAEYGRGTGAVINVVTKSGSNQIHGTARISISKTDWNAGPKAVNRSFTDATRYLNETRPSINLGGPIIKDHIWFFGSWERRNKWKPATFYLSPAEALAVAPTGTGKGYYKGHYSSAKLTFRAGTFSFMGLWSEDPIEIPDYYKYTNAAGQGNADLMHQNQGGWNFNAEATTTLGANTFLIARFSMKRNELNLQSDVKTGIRYQQSGYYWGAGNYDYISKRYHNQYQFNLNHFMDTSFGYHDIKVGAELYKMDITDPMHYYMPGLEYIRYNNQGLTYLRYVYEPQVYRTAKKYGDVFTLFFQDKWEITKGLTLNLGIRAEQSNFKNDEKTSVLKFKFSNAIAPRLGAAYSFGKNKLTANWGRYYDVYGWWWVDNAQPDKYARTYDVYRGAHYGYPNWHYYTSFYDVAPAGQTGRADVLKPQYMDEWGLGYERILTNKLSASLSYMHRSWNQKIEDYDFIGNNAWYFANESNYHTQDVNWGKTFRKYDAFIVTFKKNLGDDKFQFLTSYTWSKLKGFDGNDAEGTWGDDPYTYVNALGYLPNDTRHQVRFYGSVIAPFDIVVGVNLFWFSGYPFTDYVSMLYNDPAGTPTPTGFDGQYYNYLVDPRGASGRYPATWRLDLRVEKRFKVKNLFTAVVYIDIFNLLNQQDEITRDNYIGEAELNGVIGGFYIITYANPTYNRFTAWYFPMLFFIGVKIEW